MRCFLKGISNSDGFAEMDEDCDEKGGAEGIEDAEDCEEEEEAAVDDDYVDV